MANEEHGRSFGTSPFPLSNGSPRAGRVDAFTLIELLVVVAIIAMLAALLLAALNHGRATAR